MKRALACLLLAACTPAAPRPASTPPAPVEAPPPPEPVAPTVPPLERAKQILDAQLAALMSTAEDDVDLRNTFDPAAFVLLWNPDPISDARRGFRDAISQRNPHQTVREVRCDDLVANGTANAVWFTCMLWVRKDDTVTEDTETIRVTELATAESGWRVAVAAFNLADSPRASKGAQQANATTQLSLLATDAHQIAEHLEPTAVVTGFEERYTSAAAARAFLEGLPAMSLEYPAHEVIGNGWGYVLAQLTYETDDRKYPAHVSVLLIATRDRTRGWRVVAVHYR